MKPRPNWIAGGLSVLWLGFITIPIYAIVAGSVATGQAYMKGGPVAAPASFTLDSFVRVLAGPFLRYFLNTTIITVSTVVLALVLALPLSYVVVRGKGWASRGVFRLFLFGLAIPSQAVIIPMFWVISAIGLYDTWWGVVLPTAAFSMPISVLILTSGMREITNDLYEAMALDGASAFKTFIRLVIPLSKPSIATLCVFNGLHAWNGFLFPLVLTQSDDVKVVTLGLYSFIFQYGADFPALFAAVILSAIPLVLLYLFARRALVAGLMGVGGK
ncbi:MAG: carbohydrate ABC transporter permease [Bifidobacteriaceae bacterium]|nr:carbohydrate ABC transporter permease [Bifidobacteriaceae bacterium]